MYYILRVSIKVFVHISRLGAHIY